MVHLCNSLALLNPRVTVEAIDSNAFLDLARRFAVSAVPKVIINDAAEVPDVVPAAQLISRIREASAGPPPRAEGAAETGPPPGGDRAGA